MVGSGPPFPHWGVDVSMPAAQASVTSRERWGYRDAHAKAGDP